MYNAERTSERPPRIRRTPDVAQRGNPDKSRNLLAIQFAQFRQGGNQYLARFGSHARHRSQNFVLRVPIGMGVYHALDAGIRVGNLSVESLDHFLNAFLHRFLFCLMTSIHLLRSHVDQLLFSRNKIIHLLHFAGGTGLA